jgi:mannan endo-1,4-beta-mannosidase
MGYLADHMSLARAINKPLVLEAFGASRDGGSPTVQASTEYRDRYYTMILEAFYRLAEEGNVAAGSNVWSWAGTGRPDASGERWGEGEPYTGDPPHEPQGRYSIYDADESTLDILAEYASLMQSLNLPLDGEAPIEEEGEQ